MRRAVKTRTYHSDLRRQQAERTRLAVLRAARWLLVNRGYAATTVERVAARARVSVDTVYASVGRKPELVLAVIDMVLGSADEPVPSEERGYVAAIRAAPTARAKIETYAEALAALLPTTAPLQEALRHAGATDRACARAWSGLVERRASNMLLFAADLRATGELRSDLDDRQVADVVWAMNAAEYFLLLRQRGWTPRQYADHLVDTWTRVLLAAPA